jgi:vesicle-fusing ATPase
MVQRQWIGLSLSGDSVTIEPLPSPPSPGAPSYLESMDLEVGFLKPKLEMAEQFSADDMAKNFLKAFAGQVFARGEMLMFDFRGVSLRATIVGIQTLELADAQNRGGGGGSPSNMGLLMDKTDLNFIKAGDSAIKLKSSGKK